MQATREAPLRGRGDTVDADNDGEEDLRMNSLTARTILRDWKTAHSNEKDLCSPSGVEQEPTLEASPAHDNKTGRRGSLKDALMARLGLQDGRSDGLAKKMGGRWRDLYKRNLKARNRRVAPEPGKATATLKGGRVQKRDSAAEIFKPGEQEQGEHDDKDRVPTSSNVRGAALRWLTQSKTRRLVSLCSFVPRLLKDSVLDGGNSQDVGFFKTPSMTALQGAVMIADITGFTKLTESLSKEGPSGVELLTTCMNSYFSKVMELVFEYGGDVTKFAGDSMIIAFCPRKDESTSPDSGLKASTVRCVHCAYELVETYGHVKMLPNGDVVPLCGPKEKFKCPRREASLDLTPLGRGHSIFARMKTFMSREQASETDRIAQKVVDAGQESFSMPSTSGTSFRPAREEGDPIRAQSDTSPGSKKPRSSLFARATTLFLGGNRVTADKGQHRGGGDSARESPNRHGREAGTQLRQQATALAHEKVERWAESTSPPGTSGHSHPQASLPKVLRASERDILPRGEAAPSGRPDGADPVLQNPLKSNRQVLAPLDMTAGEKALQKKEISLAEFYPEVSSRHGRGIPGKPRPVAEAREDTGRNRGTRRNRATSAPASQPQPRVPSQGEVAAPQGPGRRLYRLATRIPSMFQPSRAASDASRSCADDSTNQATEESCLSPKTPETSDPKLQKRRSGSGSLFTTAATAVAFKRPISQDALKTRSRRFEQNLASARPSIEDTLSLKVMAGAGSIFVFRVGGQLETSVVEGSDEWENIPRWEIFIGDRPHYPGRDNNGHRPPIQQIAEIDKFGKPGDIVVSEEIIQIASGEFHYSPLYDGSGRVTGVPKRDNVRDPGQKIVGEGGTRTMVLSSMGTLSQAVQLKAANVIKMHVLDSVRQRIEAGHTDYINEIRRLTVVFLGFPSLTECKDGCDEADELGSVQAAMAIVQKVMRYFGGSLLQFRCDEKGFLAIAAFGLTGRTHGALASL
eukprot:evm.model.scf_1325.5 EVM.evm.TU.scf_1325.5   scf_1325:35935-41194(+)